MNDIEELIQSLNEEETAENKVSLKDILASIKKCINILWRKKWIILIAGILGGIIGLIYAYNRPISYKSHYTFTVGGSSSSGAGLGGLTTLLNMGGSNMDAFSGDNVLELLKSNSLVEKTLLSPICYHGDSITFMEYSLICDSIRSRCEQGTKKQGKDGVVSVCDVSFPIGQTRESFSRAQDSILMEKAHSMILKNIAVARRDKKLSFMEYTFSYTDEDFAKSFSEAHLNAVSEFYIYTKTALARKNVESFQSKADSVRKNLDQCLARRAAYSDANRDANGQFVNVAKNKIDTDIQILSTTYTEMIKNIEVLKMDLAKETPLIQIIDEPRLPLPNDKMRKLKGIIAGGFLAGILACLAILGWNLYPDLKRKFEEDEPLDETTTNN